MLVAVLQVGTYITNKMLASCTVSLRVLENRSELIESFQKYLFENTNVCVIY